jgi:hypothetical protein
MSLQSLSSGLHVVIFFSIGMFYHNNDFIELLFPVATGDLHVGFQNNPNWPSVTTSTEALGRAPEPLYTMEAAW